MKKKIFFLGIQWVQCTYLTKEKYRVFKSNLITKTILFPLKEEDRFSIRTRVNIVEFAPVSIVTLSARISTN